MGHLGAIQSAALSLGMELRPVDARDADEIERAVTAFARSPNGGLIVLAGAPTLAHRELIITLAAKDRLPAVYSDRLFVGGGGLLSYDPDRIDQYRRAAGYVDRILRGRQARRPAGAGADEIRAGNQHENRQGARPRRPAHAARPRRRGDRVTPLFAALHMSPYGTTRKRLAARTASANWGEADSNAAAR
jgi:hypothetical protein